MLRPWLCRPLVIIRRKVDLPVLMLPSTHTVAGCAADKAVYKPAQILIVLS